MPSSASVVVTLESLHSHGGSAMAAKLSAPRLPAWPLGNSTYSSPIRKLKLIGHPVCVSTATTIKNPVMPGSMSEARKLVVCAGVRHRKTSETSHVSPETKNKCSETVSASDVLVMLIRAFPFAGSTADEV